MKGEKIIQLTEKELYLTLYKAIELYDSTHTWMSVDGCALFLGITKEETLKEIQNFKIEALEFESGYKIPKSQFFKKILDQTL